MVKLNFNNLKTIIMTAASIHQFNTCDEKRLEQFTASYYRDFEKSLKHNGKQYTLTLFKAIHLQAMDVALRRPIKPIPFHKSSKDNVSRTLALIKPLLLSSDDKFVRLVLTCTRVYEAIRLEPKFDSKSITDGYRGEFDLDEFNKELLTYLNNSRWFNDLKLRFKSSLKPSKRVIGRLRSGPNGQAIVTAHIDAVALTESGLYQTVQEFNKHMNQTLLNDSMDHCVKHTDRSTLGKVYTGRIALSSERGGKTRLFAMGDMWTMNSLQCIHDAGMKALKTIPMDSTFNQGKGFFRILSQSLNKAWIGSADLTKATDRLPVSTMETVLLALTDDQRLSSLWKELLTNRDFRYEDKTFRWAIGTPLGLISGWTIFAIAHHCLVQFSYFTSVGEKKDLFKSYQILGDDICIWHRVVYDQYAKILKGLGINISPEKSMKSVPGTLRFEFAKRTACNGREITGFPFDLLELASRSIYGYIDLVRYQIETKFYENPLSLSVVPNYLNQKGYRYLSILLWEADVLCPAVAGNIAPNAALVALRRMMFHIHLMRLKETSERLCTVLGDNTLLEYYGELGLVVTEQLLSHNGPGYHPVVESLNHTGIKLYQVLEHLWTISDAEDLVTHDSYPHLKELCYLPLPHMGAYFERPGRRDPNLSRQHSEIVLEASIRIRSDQPVLVETDKAEEGG